jgi:hypothetical protein
MSTKCTIVHGDNFRFYHEVPTLAELPLPVRLHLHV